MESKVDIVKVYIEDNYLGRMVLSPDNLVVFEYDTEFIRSGFSISPFYLPLRPGIFTARRDPFNGLFGIFNDSLPDGWGNLLIDRYLISKGIKPQTFSLLDRLGIVGSSGMGAIRYIPDNHIKAKQEIDDINILAKEVVKVLSETDYDTTLDVLAEKGGSSGGARPKVLLNIKGEPWIVKFPSSVDPSDIGNIEYTYSLVAGKCGIEMPETAIFEEKYFGVRRFDREKEKRIHMHTVSGLLYASHRYPSLDYIELIKATLALTKNIEDSYSLFRLMVFNVLTGNKDDHAKNFSFIHKSGKWQLSPAYDLVLSDGFNNNHSTTIAGQGNPGIDDILKVATETGLKEKKCMEIFDEVYESCREIRIDDWK
ncbi:MAG: type II toxin-antitoxin system HipA family toxin [Bacteroidetes bacterium]|nr:MAG: type II toxin-antitoxin system HipA family toxin [Bacteroidota bacterium]